MKNLYIAVCILLCIYGCTRKDDEPDRDSEKPMIEIEDLDSVSSFKPNSIIPIKGRISDVTGLEKIDISISNLHTKEIYASWGYEVSGTVFQLDTSYICIQPDGTKIEIQIVAVDNGGYSKMKSFVFRISNTEMQISKADAPYHLEYPSRFGEPFIPDDNKLTVNRVDLGKLLFFDPILSGDSSVSCASCHNPALSFSDNKQFSSGVGGKTGPRNSMAIINMAWANSFFWDGSALSLEAQARAPIVNPLEMNNTIEEAIARLNRHKDYPQLFFDAYQRLPDEYSLLRAIASYQRTLVSFNSRYDQFFYEDKWDAFSDSDVRGFQLFYGSGDKVHCGSCHSGNLFTNNAFENNGLYRNYTDQGRYEITFKSSDKGKFKVPTLRNIELTAPYMHNGSFKTLEEVIEHYGLGGQGHTNQSSHVHAHSPLTTQEKEDLVNFLKTLTDTKFINENSL
jgi:cytochrome c peroxidase